MKTNKGEVNGLKKIKLELMDWKAVEQGSEQAIRTALLTIEISGQNRLFAKQKITELDGKTSEQENLESKQQNQLAG